MSKWKLGCLPNSKGNYSITLNTSTWFASPSLHSSSISVMKTHKNSWPVTNSCLEEVSNVQTNNLRFFLAVASSPAISTHDYPINFYRSIVNGHLEREENEKKGNKMHILEVIMFHLKSVEEGLVSLVVLLCDSKLQWDPPGRINHQS